MAIWGTMWCLTKTLQLQLKCQACLGLVGLDMKWCGSGQLTVEASPTLRPTRPLSVCQWRMQHFHILYSTWWKTSIFNISPVIENPPKALATPRLPKSDSPLYSQSSRPYTGSHSLPTACTALRCSVLKRTQDLGINGRAGSAGAPPSLNHSIQVAANSSSEHFELCQLNAHTTWSKMLHHAQLNYNPHYYIWLTNTASSCLSTAAKKTAPGYLNPAQIKLLRGEILDSPGRDIWNATFVCAFMHL